MGRFPEQGGGLLHLRGQVFHFRSPETTPDRLISYSYTLWKY